MGTFEVFRLVSLVSVQQVQLGLVSYVASQLAVAYVLCYEEEGQVREVTSVACLVVLVQVLMIHLALLLFVACLVVLVQMQLMHLILPILLACLIFSLWLLHLLKL